MVRVNSVIRSPRAYAANGAVVLEFDAAKVLLLPAASKKGAFFFPPWPKRLVVRLFDQHGQYLTHFTTRECFAPDTNEEWKETYIDSPSWRDNTANPVYYSSAKRVTTLLQPVGNRFVYPINQRDLDYTAYVEVGFLPVGTADCIRW